MVEPEPTVDARAARLARARDYPYDVRAESYLFVGGRVAPLPDPASARAGRVPVLAYGSNRSPAQLARKFAHLAAAGGADAEIPVERARLAGFDVVYSAHFASYGSMPAMLRVAPATTVHLAVTWLTATQLAFMNESETRVANYAYRRLEHIDLRLDDGSRLAAVEAYVGRRGSLMHDGAPVALAAVRAEGRGYRARTTAAMLRLARDRLMPGLDLDDFILRLVDDADFRRRQGARVAEGAAPFTWPHVVPPGA